MKAKIEVPFTPTELGVLLAAAQVLSDSWERRAEKPILTQPRDDDDPRNDAEAIAAARAELVQFLRYTLAALPREQATVVLADTYGRMIGVYTLSEGGERSCEIPHRELARLVTANGAFYALLAHNHPGGDANPSDADLAATAVAASFLAAIDCHLLDHIVVASNGVRSIARALLTKRGQQKADPEQLAQCWAPT